MFRVLVVTDDERLAGSLSGALAGANVISTDVGSDLRTLEVAMGRGGPHLLVIDARFGTAVSDVLVVLKEQPGLEQAPVIGMLPDIALSELPLPPVDDFVLDHAPLSELVLRILARLSKLASPEEDGNVVRGGKLEVDVDNYKARIGDETLDLTYKEFELLRFLVTHKGRVFTREALLNQVWGYDFFGGARTVDVHIRRLRAKLGAHQELIETVRNVGYRFSEEE